MFFQQLSQPAAALQGADPAAQRRELHACFADSVEQNIHLVDIGSHGLCGARRMDGAACASESEDPFFSAGTAGLDFDPGRRNRSGVAQIAWIADRAPPSAVRSHPALQHRAHPFPGHRAPLLAKRRQGIFDGMRLIGDLALLDDPRRAFERVGQRQHQCHQFGRGGALVQFERALAELIQEIARFDTKIPVGIARHCCLLYPRRDSAIQRWPREPPPAAARCAAAHATGR